MVELNNYKELYEKELEFKKKMVKWLIDNCNRQDLISILKKRKIISRDWSSKGESYQFNGFPKLKEMKDG